MIQANQKQNRFSKFAEEVDQEPGSTNKDVKIAPKPNTAQKKVVVKPKRVQPAQNAETGAEEFDGRVERPQTATRGNERGGRGGRGRGDGERRGGERRGGERGGRGGERGGRGGRGGRGRGGQERPKTAVVEGEAGPDVERAERGGQRQRYQGKPREEAHPMDRQDGTGRAHRGERKGGERRGGFGNDRKPVIDGEVVDAEGNKVAAVVGEEKKPQREQRDRKPREPRERRERPVEEEKKAEPVVEEEEVGFTLDDYMNQKKAAAQGLLKKNEVRGHEKLDTGKVAEEKNDDKINQGISQVKAQEMHRVGKFEGAELLGFAPVKDEDEGFRGGRRGGRGGDRPQTQARGGRQAGGRKGGKLVVDDNDFPAL